MEGDLKSTSIGSIHRVMNRAAKLSRRLLWMISAGMILVSTVWAAPETREIRELFDRGAELESQAAELLSAGKRREAERRLREALETYQKVLKKSKNDPDAALRMAAILVFRQDCKKGDAHTSSDSEGYV